MKFITTTNSITDEKGIRIISTVAEWPEVSIPWIHDLVTRFGIFIKDGAYEVVFHDNKVAYIHGFNDVIFLMNNINVYENKIYDIEDYCLYFKKINTSDIRLEGKTIEDVITEYIQEKAVEAVQLGDLDFLTSTIVQKYLKKSDKNISIPTVQID